MRPGTCCTTLLVIVAVSAIGIGCAERQGAPAVMNAAEPVALDVPERHDATPWVAASGSFVAVTWGATRDGKTDVFLATSRDGGATFSPPVQVNDVAGEARLGGELPPRVSLIPRSDQKNSDIVVLWTARGERTQIKTSRSLDGGRTFVSHAAMQDPSAEGDRGWPALATDQQGNVHTIWLDHRGVAAARSGKHAHGTHTRDPGFDGVAMAQRSGLYYASVAGGRPSGERALAAGVCYCCKTALATGADGALYAAWRHVYPGNLRDIAFTVSRDGGRSFAPPLRVSEDGWAINGCPDDGPSLAAGRDGVLHAVWPTVIGGDAPEGAIFYASTRDGQRFTRRVRVPTPGARPQRPQVLADHRGRIYVAWDDSVFGQRAAALREVLVKADGTVDFGPVVPLTTHSPSMAPVLAPTDRGLVAVWTHSSSPSRVMVGRVEPGSAAAGQ